ncbi:MAG: PQQ-binding-like beta-propeller repeat protein [Verrucomicrobiota bacterium]
MNPIKPRISAVFLVLLALNAPVRSEDFSQRICLISEGYGKNLVALRNEQGEILWKQKVRNGQHDLHMLDNGNILMQDGWRNILEITLDKKVVWSYNAGVMNGNKGKRVEVHAFLRLPDGNTMIAESGPKRLIEVNAKGEIQKEIPLTVERPHHHRDTRLVRRLENGNYLVCHEADGKVREYDDTGKVVWDYHVRSKVYGAIGLKNGNILIASGGGNSVIEVNKADRKVVWEIKGTIPGTDKAMKWMTTLIERDNGNLIIGNCHAGKNSPQMFEITRDKKLVWDMHDWTHFGNGVASNDVLTDEQAELVRAKLKDIPEDVRVNDRLIDAELLK